ncbi:MAG: hypothetical protein HZA93_02340 [Verrucomicrobia bacterium]|nr:hypothetical protein [Verrucomicrobiota bacterium]
MPYDPARRAQAIADCDVWLGLGGSPFQSAQNRWFIDHLLDDAALCTRENKAMFYLGIGVQTATELAVPDTQHLIAKAAGIWTRDQRSAERIQTLPDRPDQVEAAADLAHVFFRANQPPAAVSERVTLVPNFDYATWSGQSATLEAISALPVRDRVWLAQESRELPGAERALHAALPESEKGRWRLASPDLPGAPLAQVLSLWPSGGWLVSARYHAALAGAWARSRIVIIDTNEKLRAAAHELSASLISADAPAATVARALVQATPATPPVASADRALAACAAFLHAAS